jgi:hypothetical protein
MHQVRLGIGLAFVLLSGAAWAQPYPPAYPPPGGFVPQGVFPPPGGPYGQRGSERPSYSGPQGRDDSRVESYDRGTGPGQYGRGYADPNDRSGNRRSYGGGSNAPGNAYGQGGYGSGQNRQGSRSAPSANQGQQQPPGGNQYGGSGNGPGQYGSGQYGTQGGTQGGSQGQYGQGNGATQPPGATGQGQTQGVPGFGGTTDQFGNQRSGFPPR